MGLGAGLALGGTALAGAGLQAWQGHSAAKQQSEAAKAALAQQMALAEQAGGQFERNIGAAKNIIGEGSQAAQQIYGQQFAGAQEHFRGAQQQVAGGLGLAQQALSPLQQLQQYGAGATQAVNLGDPFANFQADPGYQFRQQQGEQSINRAASAQGGRFSGRTLKELSQFNQGLASQEFQNFAQRQMGLRGQNLQAALTAQQNQMGLAQMGFGAQGQLAGFGMQAGLAGAGISQQQAAARMGAGEYLGNTTFSAAQQQAQMNAQRAALYGGLAGSTIQAQTGPVQFAGGPSAAIANAAGSLGQSAAQAGMYALMQGGGGGGGTAPAPVAAAAPLSNTGIPTGMY
jgi:hypothetical protein